MMWRKVLISAESPIRCIAACVKNPPVVNLGFTYVLLRLASLVYEFCTDLGLISAE
jgi:hypothetical protein